MTSYTAHRITHNEGGYGYNPHETAMRAAAETAAEQRIQSLIARADEIRVAWNDAVAKYTVGGQVPTCALAKIEAAAGVTRSEMLTLKSRLSK